MRKGDNMQTLAQFAEARDIFFRQHGYLPNTVSISVPNLQTLRAESLFLVEGLTIKRRQGVRSSLAVKKEIM